MVVSAAVVAALAAACTPPDVPDKTILGLKEYLFVYSIELSLLLIAGFFIIRYKIADYPHIYWIPLTAIIVLKVGRRETLKRVTERTLGTLAGCVLGSTILYLQLGFIVESVAMIICIYLFIYYLYREINYRRRISYVEN